jgi:hypothetical protein
MAQTLPRTSERTFRVLTACFGLSKGEVFKTCSALQPHKNSLVAIEFNGTPQLARYLGPCVELADGTITFLYSFVGTVL